MRRARGLVPLPIYLGKKLSGDSFAAGGDLKAVFALGRQNAVFMSGHFGDLYEVRADERRQEAIDHMKGLLGIMPLDFACDMHPGYVSGRQYQVYMPKKIQHHHAHVYSVMAEHHLTGRLIGVAFDGTGYGEDGTVWGGEFFECEGDGSIRCRRAAHLVSVPMSGGDASAKDARLPLEGYISAAVKNGYLSMGEHPFGEEKQTHIRRAALLKSVGVVSSSSMGRLFDAAAAVLGFGDENHFEGQLACRLEYAAERFEKRADADRLLTKSGIHFDIPIREETDDEGNTVYLADGPKLIAELIKARNEAYAEESKEEDEAEDFAGRREAELGTFMDALAFAFHEAVACMTVAVCDIIRGSVGERIPVALSGGTFANELLLELVVPKLREAGFDVYFNEKVPCGDGGLALGQMYALTF